VTQEAVKLPTNHATPIRVVMMARCCGWAISDTRIGAAPMVIAVGRGQRGLKLWVLSNSPMPNPIVKRPAMNMSKFLAPA
jgi:hypothetical protein